MSDEISVSIVETDNIAVEIQQAPQETVDLSGKISHSLATAENDFLVGAPTPFGTFVKKTLAQVKTILGLGTGGYATISDYFKLNNSGTEQTVADPVIFSKRVTSSSHANSFSASPVFDMSLSNIQTMPVTGDTTISLSNLTEGVNMIILTNNATPGWTVTLDSTFGIKTDNSASLIKTANSINIITIIKYGSVVLYTIETKI